MFYFYLISAIENFISAIEYLMFAIERLICNAFMFLRMLTTSGPNMKRHIINSCIEQLGSYIHVLSIFCSEHRACHSVSHFSQSLLAHSR